MNNFEYWKSRYEKGFATDDHLRRLVAVSVLTTQEYEDITGEPYDS